jgi:N utilization substance protein A
VESVEDLDAIPEEKLMHETGLGLGKVRKIKQGARNFLDSEQKVIDDARRALAETTPEETVTEG